MISQLAHTHGLVPLQMEWYYQNLAITPLLVQDGAITYRIEIPYVGNAIYERYTIETYAVPVNESGITAKVIVRPDMAVHTTEAYWFVPQQCTGWRPQLCHTGALFKEPTFNCERGLLTGYTKDTSACKIEQGFISTTTIRDIGDGGYVVLTLGDEYTLSCRGEHQQRHQLSMGTYLVQLNDQCVMPGSAWRLMGEIHQFVNATAEKTGMTIPELDLAAMVPAHWHMNNTRYLPLNNDFNDDNMNELMNQMEDMNNDGYNEGFIGHSVAWGAMGIACIILILGAVLGRYIYVKRKKINYFLADAKQPAKPPRTGISHAKLTEETEETETTP